MKRLAQFACFLMMWGVMAAVTHADTTATSPASDPRVILNDPSCTQEFCVTLTFNTSQPGTVFVPDLTFLVPNPPGELSIGPGESYTCSSNVFFTCLPLENVFESLPPTEFYGFTFIAGSLYNGESLSLSSNAPIELTLPPGLSCSGADCSGNVVDLAPEPSAALLCAIGLAFLLACAGKRFGLSIRA
jgi:hypothetical protein